jgi:hypothetical protein
MSETFLCSYIREQINRSIVRTMDGRRICYLVRFTNSKTLQDRGYSEDDIINELYSEDFSIISTEHGTAFAIAIPTD